MPRSRNPRLTITLPPGIFRALERWAAREGNKPTPLATSLIEQGVREAMLAGLIDAEPEEAANPMEGLGDSAIECLRLIGRGKMPKPADLIKAAGAAGLEYDEILGIAEAYHAQHQAQKAKKENGSECEV